MKRAGTERENGAKSIERNSAGRPTGYWKTIQPGVWLAMPNMLLLLLFFAAPMLMILGYAFTPPLTFEILSEVTTENFESIIAEGYYRSFLWAMGLSGLSTIILLLLCYPIAYGLAKVFGRWSSLITLLFVMPLFVSETVKLYGWSIFFLKGGILQSLLNVLGLPPIEFMYTVSIIVLGLVYIYFPFMLFPLVLGINMVPNQLKAAARDLGCSRLRVFWLIELPLARRGIVVGSLLSFVLALSSMSESRMLGGRSVIMIADDIEFAFGYQQNWPLGSALSVVLAIAATIILLVLLRWLDIGGLVRRR